MIRQGKTPLPDHVKKELANKKGGGDGIPYDRYVPERHRTKFMRYQIADFDDATAESFRDLTYDQVILRKWITTAKATADNHWAQAHKPKPKPKSR